MTELATALIVGVIILTVLFIIGMALGIRYLRKDIADDDKLDKKYKDK